MGRPRSNELARSGHTPLGEHARVNNVDTPQQQDDSPVGPVPAENQPGHRPDNDQDKPVKAFASRFPAAGDTDQTQETDRSDEVGTTDESA